MSDNSSNTKIVNVGRLAKFKKLMAKGSATQGVYFDSNGTPQLMTNTLGKSVPANAVFTDTTYESKTAASGGTDVSLVTTGEKYTWNNKAEKDVDAVEGNIAEFDNSGNPVDSGVSSDSIVLLEDADNTAVIADFDPQADTLWKGAQVLSNAEKAQVKTNLGLPQEIYSKSEVNGLVSTPHQEYVTVATYASLPASGSEDTIYRVSNYDGTAVATGVYSEYAWNGSAYVFLAAKSSVGEVFDITEYNSNTKYADLTAALGNNGANIPEGIRKGGMSVKFVQSSDNRYVQYRLAASNWSTDIHNWTSEDPYFIDKIMQEVNEAIDENTPIEIHGDVTNAPDEEDLTSVNVGGTNVLKFKDKAYNPLTYSGLGRKILRKKIVDGVNTFTQEMVSDANTIYIIQYDFTLASDVTIPANCVLEFDGGSVSGIYTITGNNSSIKAGIIKIFNTDVTLAGTWNIVEAYPEWFGIIDDMAININKCLTYFKNCILTAPEYIVKTAIETTLNSVLKGRAESCVNILSYSTSEHVLIIPYTCTVSNLTVKLYSNEATRQFVSGSIIRVCSKTGNPSHEKTLIENITALLAYRGGDGSFDDTIGFELYANSAEGYNGFAGIYANKLSIGGTGVGYYINCPSDWITANTIENSWTSACYTAIKFSSTGLIVDNNLNIRIQSGQTYKKIFDINGNQKSNNIISGMVWDADKIPTNVLYRWGSPKGGVFPKHTSMGIRNQSNANASNICVMALNQLITLRVAGGNYTQFDASRDCLISLQTINGTLYVVDVKETFDINPTLPKIYYLATDSEVYVYAQATTAGTYYISVLNGSVILPPSEHTTAVTSLTEAVRRYHNGEMKFENHAPLWYNSQKNRFESATGDSRTGVLHCGTTAQRQALTYTQINMGFEFFDYELHKPLWFISGIRIDNVYYENGWVDADGNVVQ